MTRTGWLMAAWLLATPALVSASLPAPRPPAVPPPGGAPAAVPLWANRDDAARGRPVNDASITASVKARLMADGMIGRLPIDVKTQSRVVYLSGEAENRDQILRAETLARKVDGVARVENQLRIDNRVGG
ncbi:MAG: BON domain-containing protein [Nitrospiria bacterium]